MTAPQPELPPGARPWQPANDIEVALAQAIVAGDRREFFRLVAVADLYLPTLAEDRDRAGPQRFITAEFVGQTYLTVFTSVPSLVAVMTGQADAYRVTNYAELRRKWPVPHWRLAINPGTPIDAYLRIEAVEAAAVGDLRLPTAAEIVAEGVGPDGVTPEAAMSGAAAIADVDGYIRGLLDAEVIVPVVEPVDAERILQPGFPWRLVRDGESMAVEVFTSPESHRAAGGDDGPTVTVPFTALVVAWPDESCQLSVDPGGPLALRLPGRQLQAFALWLPDVAREDQPAEGEVRA